ncbi:hypothetical protein Dimus_030160, partial [Dionaea muscipula]
MPTESGVGNDLSIGKSMSMRKHHLTVEDDWYFQVATSVAVDISMGNYHLSTSMEVPQRSFGLTNYPHQHHDQ